ncbi:MAG: coproporphyrinogen dehydrogenase HemZ [Clostridia bacterium]|nr:coproporphyrinogen dehydrogenase HemZ [Clostridia bacterium]
MKLCNIGHNFDYEMEKLIRLFLPFEKIEVLHTVEIDQKYAVCEVFEQGEDIVTRVKLILQNEQAQFCSVVDKNISDTRKETQHELGRQLFYCFEKITNYRPDWGILTGVRPAKLFLRYCNDYGEQYAEEFFKNKFLVTQQKLDLCKKAVKGEEGIIALSGEKSFSLYLSVPFCPTRCSYCSFVSHSIEKAQDIIPQYVELLCRELEITANIAQKLGLRLETVYMGGGTPTTLNSEQLDLVLGTVNRCFDMSTVREFTVEAGRPDTIDENKLMAIKRNGVTRISINPQTMNDSVLETIGRKHTASDTVAAFNLARKIGFDNINMDLIAVLPTDTFDSFKDTVYEILKLDPESVTIHSLSMKRASTLNTNGQHNEIHLGAQASKMVEFGRDILTQNGILPYYMYRQSKTVGNLENVGYAKQGYEGLYNVYIMDETHTILACGASAVTKLKDNTQKNIKRIFNYKYPYEYISGFEELISRKAEIGEFYGKYFI